IAKLNAILQDADLMSAADITNSLTSLKGDVPEVANTLGKLYNIIQGITTLKREDIDTIAELNAILTDADLVRVADLADMVVGLNLKRRSVQFFFSDDHWDDDHDQNTDRNTYVFRGKITSLSQTLTDDLSSVTYKSRLDSSSIWTFHATLTALQNWINTNVAGDEETGTLYWIKCLPQFKAGRDGDAVNIFKYSVI
ncbi:MAG: hypothetical protein ACOYXT_20410, partial [Bacteroidota bacterium]